MGRPKKSGVVDSNSSVPVSFRLSSERVSQLDELCTLFGVSRREFFDGLIIQEYDKINGNVKLKAMLKQLDVLKANIQDMASLVSSDD